MPTRIVTIDKQSFTGINMMSAATEFGNKLLATYWDNKDVDAVVSCFADDAVWHVNTMPPARGRQALAETTKTLMASTKSSKHYGLTGYESSDGKMWTVRGNVAYEMEGKDEPVHCVFCDVMAMNEDRSKIVECWTYMDTSPLSAAAK